MFSCLCLFLSRLLPPPSFFHLFFLPLIKCKEEAGEGGMETSLLAGSMRRAHYRMFSAVQAGDDILMGVGLPVLGTWPE